MIMHWLKVIGFEAPQYSNVPIYSGRVGIFTEKEEMIELNDGCIILKITGSLLGDQSTIYSCS